MRRPSTGESLKAGNGGFPFLTMYSKWRNRSAGKFYCPPRKRFLMSGLETSKGKRSWDLPAAGGADACFCGAGSGLHHVGLFSQTVEERGTCCETGGGSDQDTCGKKRVKKSGTRMQNSGTMPWGMHPMNFIEGWFDRRSQNFCRRILPIIFWMLPVETEIIPRIWHNWAFPSLLSISAKT